MEHSPKGKSNKKLRLISKTWERCKSFSGGITAGRKPSLGNIVKSKSWPRNFTVEDRGDHQDKGKRSTQVAPVGCFSVYVGPVKQRFVIKTECVNHPLFRTLLEEAESEYGYSSEGPLVLPCEIDRFVKVLSEMDDCEDHVMMSKNNKGCNFVNRSHAPYHLITAPRLVAFNSFHHH